MKKNKEETKEEIKEEEKKADEIKEEGEEEKLKKELAEKEDKYLRLLAEYDNFRKRSAKEKQDIYSSSKADIIKEFLPVIDNFERANITDSDYESYKKGMELIFNQLMAILEKFDVTGFGEVGEKFDPNIHSAVMITQDENLGENEIAQVFSKGYKLGDKIIREAVVQVANS